MVGLCSSGQRGHSDLVRVMLCSETWDSFIRYLISRVSKCATFAGLLTALVYEVVLW